MTPELHYLNRNLHGHAVLEDGGRYLETMELRQLPLSIILHAKLIWIGVGRFLEFSLAQVAWRPCGTGRMVSMWCRLHGVHVAQVSCHLCGAGCMTRMQHRPHAAWHP